jgi:hypothetical protein
MPESPHYETLPKLLKHPHVARCKGNEKKKKSKEKANNTLKIYY